MTMTEQVTPSPWVPSAESFGARLALIRNHLGGWNVSRTAKLCALDAQSWRSWEAGHHPRDYPTVCQRIADATGCSLGWLMGLPDFRWNEIYADQGTYHESDLQMCLAFDRDLSLVPSAPRCDDLVR